MSLPDSARLLPLSAVNESLIGQKVRLFGYLAFADITDSALAILYSIPHRTSEEDTEEVSYTHRPAILVDLSLCLDANDAIPRESRSLVMTMGTLDPFEKPQREIRTWLKRNASLGINPRPGFILEAIVLRDASDVDLQSMEAALKIFDTVREGTNLPNLTEAPSLTRKLDELCVLRQQPTPERAQPLQLIQEGMWAHY